MSVITADESSRCVLTAKLAARPGLALHLACTSVSIALVRIAAWVCTSLSSGTSQPALRTYPMSCLTLSSSTNLDSWQLNQLRTMKVGGNGSATDFFSRHGGASLLNDSDVKKKYTSRVAELYKEELARRVKEDVAQLRLVTSTQLAFRLYS